MISYGRVKHPYLPPHAELGEHGRITTWNWIGNNASHTVEGYIVDAKPPDKVVNVLHVLLVGFRHKQCLEEPTPFRDLSDVSNLGKSGDALLHDHQFLLAI
jgi:hypothetical protein